tara:strand:- start:461 stop:679 length:219 start_codon:yes stop_codon:yes gene_type:complete
MKQIEVNNIRRKALHWWRSLNSEMKKTMVHNPSVNKSSFNSVSLISKSSLQVQRMFENWLTWEIKGGSENEQ